MNATTQPRETATLGAGCFWCIEAVLLQVPGVLAVRSGYMGGPGANPSYAEVCTGRSGHAEVVQVEFDPARLAYAELLQWFWRLHDPTTLDRQGNDVGSQYRSAIFYTSEAQKTTAEAITAKVGASGKWKAPIVTQIVAAGEFTAGLTSLDEVQKMHSV